MPRSPSRSTGRGRERGWPFAESADAILGHRLHTILFLQKNHTMKIVESLFFVGLCAMTWTACGDAPTSLTLEEANKIHGQLTRLSGELHDRMLAETAALEVEIESAMLAGDSSLALQLARIESRMNEWDVRFHDWSETVVEVPGIESDHDDHAGHDHAGHDHGSHAGHDHDHSHHAAISLEGMSDDEILAIQEALLAELETLQALYEESMLAKQAIQQ